MRPKAFQASSGLSDSESSFLGWLHSAPILPRPSLRSTNACSRGQQRTHGARNRALRSTRSAEHERMQPVSSAPTVPATAPSFVFVTAVCGKGVDEGSG